MRIENSGRLEADMLLNGIDIPLELLSVQGHFVSANHAFLKLLQLPEIQKGKPCHKFMACPLHCHHALDERCILTEVIRTGKPAKHATQIGNRCYIIRANPIFDAAGKISCFVKSYTDVSEQTERIQQENVLNHCLETFFRETDMSVGMQKVSREICRYMDASRLFLMKFDAERNAADSYFEYSDDGTPFFSVVRDWRFDPNEEWHRLFADEKFVLLDDVHAPESAAILGRWADFFQQSKTRSIYVAPIFVDGRLWGDFGITYNRQTKTRPELRRNVLKHAARLFGELLGREKMRRQVLDALRKERQANQAKSFFLASVSHELRTPLNAVIGFTELLKNGGISPAETADYLNSIDGAANALLDLVNDVLDLSRLESGEMNLEKTPVDFKLLAESVAGLFRTTARQKGIRLSCEVPEMPLLKLDAARIRQILLNLVGNAVKFTVSGVIDIRASFADGNLSFSVRDTGPGIPESDLRKLTEPFVELSRMRGTNAANHGTGLGLAVVQRLLSVMNGELKIESAVGSGSLFSVQWRDVESVAGAGESSARAEVSASGEKPSLLLVDDVAMNLKVLSAICRKAGFQEIATAGSGEEAFRLLKERSFGMVLTDLWMPEMSGEQLAKEIRSDGWLASLPLFAVTADMEAGAHFDMSLFDGVIHKPVTLEKLRLNR